MGSVSSKYHIDVFKVRKLLKLYGANFKKLIDLYKKNKNRKLKLTESVIENIRESWKENKDKAYSLGQTRLYLKALHPQEWDISLTTISRAMTVDMHISYKNLNKIHKSWLTAGKKLRCCLFTMMVWCKWHPHYLYWRIYEFIWIIKYLRLDTKRTDQALQISSLKI